MRIRYDELLTLRTTHAWADGPYADVEYLLPSETAATLRGHRLLARARDGVLSVRFEVGEDGAPISSARGPLLRIGVRPSDPSFLNYTAPPFGDASAIGICRNDPSTGRLDSAVQMRLVGDPFLHPLVERTRPLSLSLLDGGQQSVWTGAVSDDRAAVTIDARGLRGACAVCESLPGAPPLTQRYYVDPELVVEHPLAVVELRVGPPFWTAAPSFVLAFQTVARTLSYYVVARGYSANEFQRLQIEDRGHQDDGRPEVKFTRLASSALGPQDLPLAALGAEGAQVAVFRSQVPLPRRRRGPRKLQLSRNGEVLVESLPLPGADAPATDLVVHVSK